MKTVKMTTRNRTDNTLFMLLKAKRNVRKMNDVLISTEIGRPNTDANIHTVFLRWLNHAKR